MLRAVLATCLLVSSAWSDTSSAMAHLGRGNESMQAERYDEAAAQFKEALQLDDTLGEARKNLAICDFELRDYPEAQKLFHSLLTTKDRALAVYYLARIDLAGGDLDSAITRLRSLKDSDAIVERTVADRSYFLGVAYFKKKQFEDAIQCFRHELKLNPRDFRADQWLARALIKSGRPEEGGKEFARAKELHEYYTQGTVAIASCRSLLSTGKFEDAWTACKPLLETDDVDKVAAIGMVFGQMGDEPHAFIAWEKAVGLDPDSPELNYNFALASFLLKDLARAKQYARLACELWPQFPEANILYGTVLYMLRDDTEALLVLKRAEQLSPGDANVQRLLADLQSHPQER